MDFKRILGILFIILGLIFIIYPIFSASAVSFIAGISFENWMYYLLCSVVFMLLFYVEKQVGLS